MRLSSFLFLFFVCIQVGFSQWTYVNTGPNVQSYDLAFADPLNGFIVGVNGTVRRTKDGGYTWEDLDVGISEWLYSISFFTPLIGFIAGDDHVFRTDDGGDTWAIVEGLNEEVRTKVYVRDSLFGIICGEQNVLRTIDAGMSWDSISINTDKWISNVHFPTPDTGYALPAGYSWEYHKTTDGGLSWDSIGLPGNWVSTMSGVYFQTGRKGFIGGFYPYMFKYTSDGGEAWTDIVMPSGTNINVLEFQSKSVGYAVGGYKIIYRTTDGGSTWIPEEIDATTGIKSLTFPSDSTVIALGGKGEIFIRNGSTVFIKDQSFSSYQSLTISPNPAQDHIWIMDDTQMDGSDLITIYNGQGVQVLCVPGAKIDGSLDISSLPSGTFFVKVTNPDRVIRTGVFQKL